MSGLTKILIVLQLVFSVAVAVLLMLMVSRQQSYKTELDNVRTAHIAALATAGHANSELAALRDELSREQGLSKTSEQSLAAASGAAVAAQAKADTTIQSLQKDLQQKETQLVSLTDTIKTLSAQNEHFSKENQEMTPKLTELVGRNADIARRNNELENAVRSAEQAIRKLQEEITLMTAKGGSASASAATANIGNQVLPLNETRSGSGPINGQVTDLQQYAGRTYISTPLGTRDGLKSGSVLAVYRGNTYLGDARVENVTANESVAVMTAIKQGETIQKGDLVMSGQ